LATESKECKNNRLGGIDFFAAADGGGNRAPNSCKTKAAIYSMKRLLVVVGFVKIELVGVVDVDGVLAATFFFCIAWCPLRRWMASSR